MSVATKSYVSSYRNDQHTDEMAQQPRSPNSNFISTQPRVNAPYTSQEPSLKRPSPSGDDVSEHRDKRQRLDADEARLETEAPRLPTNHERQDEDEDGLPESRNGTLENQSQLPQPRSPESSRREPMEAFLLSVAPSRPDASQHLLAMYGLGDLLRSVARTDPFTGDKINKLRKSYEGQIKTFGLPGRNRAEKADRAEDEPGPLRKLAIEPDMKWDAERGKHRIEANLDFQEKLKSAMQIQPGKVRNNAEWEDILGHEKPRLNPQPQQIQPARISNGPLRQLPTSSGDKRSTRGKKRSYGDESFVGYGEGYSDMDEDGEDGDDTARQKRKKDSFGQIIR